MQISTLMLCCFIIPCMRKVECLKNRLGILHMLKSVWSRGCCSCVTFPIHTKAQVQYVYCKTWIQICTDGDTSWSVPYCQILTFMTSVSSFQIYGSHILYFQNKQTLSCEEDKGWPTSTGTGKQTEMRRHPWVWSSEQIVSECSAIPYELTAKNLIGLLWYFPSQVISRLVKWLVLLTVSLLFQLVSILGYWGGWSPTAVCWTK